MALDNLITVEFTEEELATINEAIDNINTVLEGKAVYRLNQDWVEVEAGDFMWLRAFCPQACYAGGPSRFRYLLYKDVNRQMPLTLGGLKR